jgi:hypothetical protein
MKRWHGSKGSIHARYREEDGRTCIDLRVRSEKQLFDGRDPSPFRERDLDEDAVDYLVGAAEEIPAHAPLRVVVWIGESSHGAPRERAQGDPELEPAEILDAIRSHFTYERERVTRRLRKLVRHGRTILALGVTLLVVFLASAELLGATRTGAVWKVVREGLVIMGWVALWRPIELLLYDWWPLVDQRRVMTRIVEAEIEVRERT